MLYKFTFSRSWNTPVIVKTDLNGKQGWSTLFSNRHTFYSMIAMPTRREDPGP